MTVRIDLNISLDGYMTTTDQTPENPFGEDWGRLTATYTSTQTFLERVLHDSSGGGTTGVDDDFAKEYFAEVGAEIMGAGMFGLHNFPDDQEWRGWWGEEPPFRVPVFVLSHTPRPSIEMENGTIFHFVKATPQDVLRQATDVAGGLDVRVGGGATVARDFLKAGLVDRLHVAIVPIVLGRGENLWSELRGLENAYDVTAVASPSGVTHVTFER